MITGISIENFKGIRERVEIELRPLTLLFGANSAGKSSIIHALHYAREVFERRNLNADLTVAGGEFVELGGFETFVHGRDLTLKTALTFALDVREAVVPTFGDPIPSGIPSDNLDRLVLDFSTASVGIVVGWSELAAAPYVHEYTVTVDNVWLATLSCQPGRREVQLKFDSSHPVFVPARENRNIADGSWSIGEPENGDTGIQFLWKNAVAFGCLPPLGPGGVVLLSQRDALVDFGRRLKLLTTVDIPAIGEFVDELESTIAWIEEVLSHLVVGPGEVLRQQLTSSRYLGPLRATVPRNYEAPKYPDESRWASGLGAWDVLKNGSTEFVQAVGRWLGDTDKLNAGYRLKLKRFKELDLADQLVVQFVTGRAFDETEAGTRLDLSKAPTQSRVVIVPVNGSIELRPNDVGIGISQLVPVIVTALDGDDRFIAIEQPELHLHPRLQAEIADLFVEAAQELRHRFLIETHSEHFILRLQRRIRETTKDTAPEGRELMSEDVVVYHVSAEDGATRARRIDVDKLGEFVQPWPDDFFEIDFYERFGHDG